MANRIFGIERNTRNRGAQFTKPQSQPASFESSMTCDKHPSTAIYVGELNHSQTFHGGLLHDQSSSSSILSRRVSMDCQKPTCLYAINSPRAANSAIGADSQLTSSPEIKSKTQGSRTKNPPLIHPPSPAGFSWKFNTVSASIFMEPNRPAG